MYTRPSPAESNKFKLPHCSNRGQTEQWGLQWWWQSDLFWSDAQHSLLYSAPKAPSQWFAVQWQCSLPLSRDQCYLCHGCIAVIRRLTALSLHHCVCNTSEQTLQVYLLKYMKKQICILCRPVLICPLKHSSCHLPPFIKKLMLLCCWQSEISLCCASVVNTIYNMFC